jgi:hypothetical protein
VATAAAGSASVAPEPNCLANEPDLAAYDSAGDVITLCSTSTCFALAAGATPHVATRPSTPLRSAPPLHDAFESAATRPAFNAGVATVSLDGKSNRWANVPFKAPIRAHELLWLSRDAQRALVDRIAGKDMGTPDHEVIDLVDLAKHVTLAHAEVCNFHIHTEASVDEKESVALLQFFHDNTAVMSAIVDLTHERFVKIGSSVKNGYEQCTPPDDWGLYFDLQQVVALFDATRRRVGRALVSFDGAIVARLDGDFPPLAEKNQLRRESEWTIDAERRVVVRIGNEVCAGLMHVVASETAEGSPLASPRCVPRCASTSLPF